MPNDPRIFVVAPPIEPPPVAIGLAELAQWFRDLADKAERGEIVAGAVVVVKEDGENIMTAWNDAQGNRRNTYTLLAGTYHLQRHLVDGDDE